MQGDRKMRNRSRSNWVVAALLAGAMLLFLLNGCALSTFFFGQEEEKTPSELMSEGMDQMDKGYYKTAGESFGKVKDRYPYSKYAIQAELRLADALYRSGEYDQAYAAYEEFEKLHPKHESIPYVIYQRGMCHFDQMSTIDRDQTHTVRAREEFERVIGRFPKNEYAGMARKNLRKCLIFLAEHELFVGRFYYKKGDYKAALGRFTYIIEHFPDTGQYNEAIDYIGRCKERLAKQERQEEQG